MKCHQELLVAWQARKGPCNPETFSPPARQRVAALFLKTANADVDHPVHGEQNINLAEWSTELAELGSKDGLSTPVFFAELRDCELSLFALLVARASEERSQSEKSDYQEELQYMASLFSNLDELVAQSALKFVERAKPSGVRPAADGKSAGKKKNLQHEIRTPLQGALLTTELMLEDAGQGDPVSADDILAVRNSIETAVGILNDFAAHAKPE